MQEYFRSKIHSVKKWPRVVRISVGSLLVLLGLMGFFPVLGFWMIPLGLVVLAVDFPWARRALVQLKIRWRALRRRYFPRKRNPVAVTGEEESGARPTNRVRRADTSD
jgi:hypothetical protein